MSAHLLHRLPARLLILDPELGRAALVLRGRRAENLFRRPLGAAAVRASTAPALRQLTDGVDASQIFAPVRFDDHRRVHARRLVAVPDEELASIAFEGDFYEVRHLRSKEEDRKSTRLNS